MPVTLVQPPGRPPGLHPASMAPMAPMTTTTAPSDRASSERTRSDRIVWIDCEMTGLSLESDALVEVAALVTDYDLTVLGEGVDVVIRPPTPPSPRWVTSCARCTPGRVCLRAWRAGHPRGGAGRGPGVRPGVGTRGRQGPARRQHGRHRPGFLARDMPGARGPPALPHHRRVLHQGCPGRWYPRAYFAAPQKTAATAPRRHPRVDRGAALLPRGRVRAPPGPRPSQAPRASRPTTSSTTTGPPEPVGHGARWSGARRSSGYDGPRCGRTASSGAMRPPWWV